MDKSFGQTATVGRGLMSQPTRDRLLRAAAELITEVGWGAVRTRAVAERAGLPHGAVSYHFRGKRELLTEAAMHTFEQAFPVGELAEIVDGTDLVGLIESWLAEAESPDPVVAGVGIEAMLQAERDPDLRERLAHLMRRYRAAFADVLRSSQQKTDSRQINSDGLALLLGAIGDGLFLHARIDPELDVRAALVVLRDLLSR